MKRSALLKSLLFTVIVGIGTVGCSRGPKSLTPIPGSGDTTGGPGTDPFDPALVVDDGTGIEQSGLGRPKVGESDQDADYFSAQTVYFDFDRSAVKPGDIPKIQVVADYLIANPTHSVLVEGHCDERGTEEYNRALGERRALAVREVMLTEMGADPDAVFTLSLGEDVPAVDGKTEEAYSMNRRGEFILLTPKNN